MRADNGRWGNGASLECGIGDGCLYPFGSWNAAENKGPWVMEIEGDPRLINRYDVIELNPQTHREANLGAAKVLRYWLASPEG
jgi:ABC-type tungstate transport system permease subunit